jgi:hypothetical protein
MRHLLRTYNISYMKEHTIKKISEQIIISCIRFATKRGSDLVLFTAK